MPVVSFGNTSENLNYPIVEPTLDLNFARTKTLDPRISFARSTIGTYVGADGLIKTAGVNEARFDHDPVTGESLGLLVEEQRVNAQTNSNNPLSSWTLSGVTVSTTSGVVTAPNGTSSVDLLQEDTSSGSHSIYRSFDNSNVAHAMSAWVRPAGRNIITFILSRPDGSGAIFNLNTRNITYLGNGGNGFIVAYPNGWYRIGVAHIAIGDARGYPDINLNDDNGNSSYVGDGTSGMYVWGLQFELGSFPTSYIPTLGTAVTRNPDVVQITGTNFSSWWNDNEITIYTETLKTSYTQFLWKIQNSTRWYALAGPTSFYSELYPFYGGGGSFSAGSGNTSTNKLKMIVSLNNITRTHNGCCNGGNVVIGGYTPTFNNTNIIIGFISDFPGRLNSCLSRMTFYPKQIPNDQLRLLTQ